MVKEQSVSFETGFPPQIAELWDVIQRGDAFDPPSMGQLYDISTQVGDAIESLIAQDVSTITVGTPGIPDNLVQRQELKDQALTSLNDVYVEIIGRPWSNTATPPPSRTPNQYTYPLDNSISYDPLNGGFQPAQPIEPGAVNFIQHQLNNLPEIVGMVLQGNAVNLSLNPGIPDPCGLVNEILGAVSGAMNKLIDDLLGSLSPLFDAINQGISSVLQVINSVVNLINEVLDQIAQFILDQIAKMAELLLQLANLLPLQSILNFLNHPCVNSLFQLASQGGIATPDLQNAILNNGASPESFF